MTLSCLHTVELFQEDNEYLLGFIIRAHSCQADNLELRQSEIAFGSASVTEAPGGQEASLLWEPHWGRDERLAYSIQPTNLKNHKEN